MTIFKREFFKNLKGLFIWTVSIVGLVALMAGQYKAMGSGVDVDSYSQQFKDAMGMNKVDMNTFLGYYAIKASIMVTLFGGIYAAILGSTLVVKDESLLAKPISRGRIVVERILAIMACMLLFNSAVAAVILPVENDKRVIWILIGQFLLHMVFVSVGFLTAVLKIRSKAALVIPVGIVLATYVFTIIYGLSDKLKYIKYLTPFYYTDSKDIVINNSISISSLAAVCSMILVFASSGYFIYTKRDLPS